MPLGFERINERTQRPNPLINFIKPLPGSTAETSELFLSRVAAICYPFMKAHHIAVMALEEFPPNNEFVGRNFNAGEVIQLVLKNRAGGWLPMKHVQMVMVHELAHCKEMNHSRSFWKVRDVYAGELKLLWGRNYTGDGMWGRGRTVLGTEIENSTLDDNLVPENLCGGTYGSRRRKRKRGGKDKETISYAERKQRRILKKFGTGGKALGNDEGTRVKLEGGTIKKGKPRVAGSARGRELRAAAALARFEPVKEEEAHIKKEESDSETEDEYDEAEEASTTLDLDGTKLVDGKGHGLVKICEGEDDKDGNARREMAEIQEIDNHNGSSPAHPPSESKVFEVSTKRRAATDSKKQRRNPQPTASSESRPKKAPSSGGASSSVIRLDELYKRRPESYSINSYETTSQQTTSKASRECSVCSLVNEPEALTCAACANVVRPDFVPDNWKCQSVLCTRSLYINSGDAGICGICGTARK